MNTVTASLQNTGLESRAGETSGISTARNSPQLTLFAADTHASLFPSPGSDAARRMTVTSGLTCLRLSAHSGPLGACLRMLLATSAWASTRCFLTWREEATPRNRSLFRLVPSMPPTGGIECGLLPTLVRSDAKGAPRDRFFGSPAYRSNLCEALRAGPEDGIYPHPELAELLMGFPRGWTDLKDAETP